MSIADELADPRTIPLPLTVGQYHRMIRGGILPEGEPYELLGGFLMRKDRSAAGADPMRVSPAQAWIVNRLAVLSSRFERRGCHLQTQQPVSLPPYNEPEPDGAVVLGKVDDYARRFPRAADLSCVIEVADSSLRRDRTTKLRAYANAGISPYFIINLPDGRCGRENARAPIGSALHNHTSTTPHIHAFPATLAFARRAPTLCRDAGPPP